MISKKLARLDRLTEIIRSRYGASVKELAELMRVSEMTIRRDLRILDQQGVVKNLHGSTIFNGQRSLEPTTSVLSQETDNVPNCDKKNRIGKFAATLVEAGDTLIIDTGSTTPYLAKCLDENIKLKVLCYNPNIMNILLTKEKISLIFAGGYFHRNIQMFESGQGVDMIHQMRATKAFISVSGIHQTLGVTCDCVYETAAKRAALDSAFQRILLSDSSKFSKVTSSFFANLQEFQTIITDTGISQEWADRIREMGIELHIV